MLQAIFLFVYECDNIALTRDTMKTLFIGDQKKLYHSTSKQKHKEEWKKGKTIQSNRSQNIMQPSKLNVEKS